MTYLLVTAARNEAAYIERTLRAVCAQTVLPKRWVIASDRSTDATDAIVARWAKGHPFLHLLRTEGRRNRGTASKVAALASASELAGEEHDFWGNLDADVSFAPTYYERLLERFEERPALGIGGGVICELFGDRYLPQRASLSSVAGSVQLFRRECREDVGGYLPMAFGGEDAAAEIMARMRGWDVRSFPELPVYHHRRVGGGTPAALALQGRMDRVLGYHPLFELARCAVRLFHRPYVAGAVLRLLGYVGSALNGDGFALPPEAVSYLRAEQLGRARALLGATGSPRLSARGGRGETAVAAGAGRRGDA